MHLGPRKYEQERLLPVSRRILSPVVFCPPRLRNPSPRITAFKKRWLWKTLAAKVIEPKSERAAIERLLNDQREQALCRRLMNDASIAKGPAAAVNAVKDVGSHQKPVEMDKERENCWVAQGSLKI